MDGYFKVYRKILESQVFAHQTALKIWIWCLAKVTFKDRFVPLKSGKGTITVALKPGQFIFGRFTAEEELNIDGSTVYKWIQKFASPDFDMITIESNNQYSIITLCNWEQYNTATEEEVTTEGQPSNSQVTAKGQPSNSQVTQTRMLKNDKKEKESKEEEINTWRNDFKIYLSGCNEAYEKFYSDSETIKQQQELNPNVNILLSIKKGYINFWSTENGWRNKKKSKIKDIDWKRTIINSIDLNKIYYTKEELQKSNINNQLDINGKPRPSNQYTLVDKKWMVL